MSSTTAVFGPQLTPGMRLGRLFEELSELTGQRNAIDARIVEIIAEIDHDGLWGATGARSVSALVAWKTGVSPGNAATIATVAHRIDEFPLCAEGMREGRFSLDQVGVIAQRGGDGSDAHYAQLAAVATVSQLRTAVKLEPRPEPDPRPDPRPAISKRSDGEFDIWRIALPHTDSAVFEAALHSHRDALMADWKRDRNTNTGGDSNSGGGSSDNRSGNGNGNSAGAAPDEQLPMPTNIDAFMRLVETAWDTEALHRPHGQRTTVVVHLDVKDKIAALHLGPLLSDADRQYLTCDATCEAWFHRDGQPIGAGRTTRTISRRLRRALEHRHQTCAIPGCAATRGLHAHHLHHWEDGGETELHNLVLLCPYHHRQHHQGSITITGPADHLTVTDTDGQPLHPGSLARPPTNPPPAVPPCPGPTGERADWWWYSPFEPQPPPATN